MIKIAFSFLLFCSAGLCAAQNVGIGTTTPNASSILDISSNNKGLLMPRMSSAQRNAIVAPAKGLMAFDNSSNSFWYYTGTAWKELAGNSYNNDSSLVIGKQSGSISTHNLTINSNSSDSSGYLYDSGGPLGNYGNNENFEYTIYQATPNQLATDIIVMSNNIEGAYDSLILSDYYGHRYVLMGVTTGTYRFYGEVKIQFKTNFTINTTGFAIRWNGVYPGIGSYDPNQITGWYYNAAKNYMRGGVNANNTWSPDSSGLLSFAYGYDSKAKGNYSVALGNHSIANYGSFAAGVNATASGGNSIAMGDQAIATGDFSVSIGENNTANNSGSVAIGTINWATGFNSTAIGYGSNSHGDYSTAIGFNANAGNYASIAIGNYSIAKGKSSTSMGAYTDATGDYSTATGLVTRSKSYGGFVTGLYNDSSNAASSTSINLLNRIFQIGNGTAFNVLSNALTVLQNGNIGIGELNPTVPLNFAASLGNKISLWGNDTNNYGMGIQAYLMQFYSNSIFSDIAFGYGNSGDFTERMRIKGNGNIGIGTTNPNYMLTVKNDIDLDNSDANAGTTSNALRFGGGNTGEAIGSNRTTATNQWGLDFYTNSVNRMAISLSGNVGIGTTGPTAKLSVNGTANNATGNWGVFSDERVKTITGNFTDGLNVIRQINPVVFNYNDNAPFKISDDQIGIVAQELEKIAPYMVSKQAYNQFTDLREVNNQAYVFLLINAVKEQQEQITKQHVQIQAQQKENKEQKERMDALEKLIKELNSKLN